MTEFIEFHVFARNLYTGNEVVNPERNEIEYIKYIMYKEEEKVKCCRYKNLKYDKTLGYNDKFRYWNELRSEKTRILGVNYLFEHDNFLVGQQTSKLNKSVRDFITYLLKEYMPFGILDLEVFNIAKQILDKYANEETKFKELYIWIPMKFVPDTKEGKQVMIKKLKIFTTALDKGRNSKENLLDHFCREFLKISLKKIHKNSNEYKIIIEKIMDTPNEYDIDIFKIEKCKANEKFKSTPDQKQLLHSTSSDLMLSIFKDGLRIGSRLSDVNQSEDKRAGTVGKFIKDEKFMDTALILYCTVASPKLFVGEYLVENKNQVKIDYVIQMKKKEEQ